LEKDDGKEESEEREESEADAIVLDIDLFRIIYRSSIAPLISVFIRETRFLFGI